MDENYKKLEAMKVEIAEYRRYIEQLEIRITN